MQALPGLRTIAPLYDAFLVDLWGVVHDGARPFDGVVDALRELAAAGRRVVFLTNTSRAGAAVAETLAEMGVGRELYEAVISSGDVTRDALLARDDELFGRLPDPARCHHVGDPSFVPWLFELGLPFVDNVADADLVVASGAPRDADALDSLRDLLAPAAARGVPLVCTNPDRVIPMATRLALGPGAVAAAYAELGARVHLYGKPHAPIYAAARRQLDGVALSRIVAIGDLVDTDIRGARAAGIASVLVTATGVHAHALAPTPDVVGPDMLLERFAW